MAFSGESAHDIMMGQHGGHSQVFADGLLASHFLGAYVEGLRWNLQDPPKSWY